MRDRRVIYDSEDEEERLSPINSPVQGGLADINLLLVSEDGEEQRGEEPPSDSRSTDPEFFKQIYDQHNAMAEIISDTLGDKASSDKQKISEPKAKENSSSITDPTRKSAKKTAMGHQIDAKDFSGSTQVTTPSAPSAKRQDVYDFALSDEEGGPAETSAPRVMPKSGATLIGKRKRGQEKAAVINPPQLSARPRDPVQGGDDHESPRPARKKRKSAEQRTQRQVPDDVDLLVIPTTAEVKGSVEMHGREGLGSMVPDTFEMGVPGKEPPPASFFIAPPTRLTASQRQEYLQVSDSSEQASLPLPKPPQTQGQLPTNTASTIPYTTPSRYCSSVAPLPILENVDEHRSSNWATSSVRRTQLDHTQPQSSPDELNSNSPEHTSRNVKRSRESEHDELVQNDFWNSDKIGYSRETYVPRPSRRRSGVRELENISTPAQAEASTSNARKKRRDKHEHLETAQEDSWDSDNIGFHREQYVPRPSRRKPRAVVEEEDLEAPEQLMPDTCPPGEIGLGNSDNADPILISSDDEVAQERIEDAEAALDPEFLAAMPEDIRQEIISNHITQQSTRASQAHRTRGRGPRSEASSGPQPVPEEAPQPKKRGRKKKEQKDDGPSAMVEEASAEPSPAPTATAKRKRGRPRKSETVHPSPVSMAGEQAPAMESAEPVPETINKPVTMDTQTVGNAQDAAGAPKAPSKRGRKKVVEEPASLVLDRPDETALFPEQALHPRSEVAGTALEHHVDGDVQERREALQDISNSASQGTSITSRATGKSVSGGAQVQMEVTPEPREKEGLGSASSISAQGKVPFRVGLSKRSRIAPLLKIIRK